MKRLDGIVLREKCDSGSSNPSMKKERTRDVRTNLRGLPGEMDNVMQMNMIKKTTATV